MKVDAKNYGYYLETKLYDNIKSLDLFDDIIVEDTLRKELGWDASGVDHLIIYKDFIIPIQTKWRKTRRKETLLINNFLHSLDYICTKLQDKRFLFGLWVSRREPFDDNKEYLLDRNILSVSCFNSIDELVELAVDHLKAKFLQCNV